jgi:hypothetical protein
VTGDGVALPGEGTDVPVADDPAAERAALEASADEAKSQRAVHHPGLTEPIASFGRPTVVTIALCLLFGAFIAAAILVVMPMDSVNVAKQVLVWLTLTLLSLTVVYGVVHGFSWARRRGGAPPPGLMPQTDLAILNWRREKSVFLGTDQPQEDASWIFQLRMAELERAKAGRTSEPRPWNRLGARLFDYAIWGIVLALLLSELRGVGLVPDRIAYYLGHPLVAPMLITGTWIAIETLLMASLGTTPGKWLFGCYLQFSISDAYANRSMRSQLLRAFKRSVRVWWEGMGCGFPLLAPILIAIAYERVVQNQETDWDFAQDCLATYAPPGILNTVTGVCGLTAMLWLYGVAWHRPLADTIASIGTRVVAALPSAQSLLPGGLGRRHLRHRRRDHAARLTQRGAARSNCATNRTARRLRRCNAFRGTPRARSRAQGRRPENACRRQLSARRRALHYLGGPRALEFRGVGAASGRRSRRRAIIRTRSTRSARRSRSIGRQEPRCRNRPQSEGHRRRLHQSLSQVAARLFDERSGRVRGFERLSRRSARRQRLPRRRQPLSPPCSRHP